VLFHTLCFVYSRDMQKTIDIGNGVQFKADSISGIVTTIFPDGLFAAATREPNFDNIQCAIEVGYRGEHHDICWRSLIDHELLHTFVSRQIFHRESPTLRHECSDEHVIYIRRLHEEVLVLYMQHWMNNHEPLKIIALTINDRHVIRAQLLEATSAIAQAGLLT
jgi:hypothetical protein